MGYIVIIIAAAIIAGAFRYISVKNGSQWNAGIFAAALAAVFGCMGMKMMKNNAGSIQLIIAAVVGVIAVAAVFYFLFLYFHDTDTVSKKKEKAPVEKEMIKHKKAQTRNSTNFETGVKTYTNIMKQAEQFEKQGQFDLAQSFYQQCFDNSKNEEIRLNAEEGLKRCQGR